MDHISPLIYTASISQLKQEIKGFVPEYKPFIQ